MKTIICQRFRRTRFYCNSNYLVSTRWTTSPNANLFRASILGIMSHYSNYQASQYLKLFNKYATHESGKLLLRDLYLLMVFLPLHYFTYSSYTGTIWHGSNSWSLEGARVCIWFTQMWDARLWGFSVVPWGLWSVQEWRAREDRKIIRALPKSITSTLIFF
jgi:hypothetical protein